MEIFGIGAPELVVIFVIALVVLGPQRLPEMARTIGRAVYEIRKVSGEATAVFREVVDTAQLETLTQPTHPRIGAAGEPVQPDGLPYPMDNTGIHPMFRRDRTAVMDPDLLPEPPQNGAADSPAPPASAGAPAPAAVAPGQAPALWYPAPGDPHAPPVQKPATPNPLDYPPPFG